MLCIASAFLLTGLAALALQQSKLEQQMQSRYGKDGKAYLNAWFRLLDEQQDGEINKQLEQVNRFFNLGITFSDDRLLWKQKDYWATPLQTMGTRGGDCEDFSIAKYFSLLELGIPADKLRLIYVRANTQGRVQAHMVLGYFPSPSAEPLLLDNLNPQILPASQRPDLTPVFSFNSQGLWLGGTKSESDPTSRLSRWRDVLQRMHDEGF